MIAAKVPDRSRPYNTFFEDSRDFPFNGEPVMLYHGGAASTDADTMVFFRRSDVIVAGELYSTTTYPVIDLANGGSVAGLVAALNRILELAVPSKYLQDGGTYVIPGHGRISDEADVVEFRDMVVIVYARIKDLVERRMTLEQVKVARPSLDYDGRYATPSGPTSTAAFIESLYNDAVAAKKTVCEREGRDEPGARIVEARARGRRGRAGLPAGGAGLDAGRWSGQGSGPWTRGAADGA